MTKMYYRKDLLRYARMTRKAWYRAGGFSEPRCVRVTRNKRWVYLWRAF
jgi:hypothetical protein